jgi:hypothetical protein
MIDEGDWVTNKGHELLRKGKRAINRARFLALNSNEFEEAETTAREALKTLRSATNWLEDTDDFDVAHAAIDNAGRFVRETFGCQVLYEENTYFNTCPVSLSHNRSGFSPGFVVHSVKCTVCGLDPEDCEHITGRKYGEVTCQRIVTDGEILEVSIVARPRMRDARIEKMSMSNEDLQRRLPDRWKPGMPVLCDFCLTPCRGVADPFANDPSVTSRRATVSRPREAVGFSGIIAIETPKVNADPRQ